MNIVLLGGNNVANKEWIESIEKLVKPDFDLTLVQYYKHWETGKKMMDFEYEYKALLDITKELSDYVIFAKSLGAILAIKAMVNGAINPKKCIFVGVAIGMGLQMGLISESDLSKIKIPVLFIQKTNDPAIFAKDLKSMLEEQKVKNYTLKEIPGDNHDYEDIEMLNNLIVSFTK